MLERWAVENQIGKKNLVIDDCDAKQSVYIFGCKDSVLQIQGDFCYFKCTLSITFDSNHYVAVLSWIPVKEVRKSLLVLLQCAGKVNNITVDKCTKMGIVFTVSRKII